MKEEEGDPTSELRTMLGPMEGRRKLSLRHITMEKMMSAVRRMPNESSMGDDNMPQDLFKLIVQHGAPVFLKIVNMSITQSKFHTDRPHDIWLVPDQ